MTNNDVKIRTGNYSTTLSEHKEANPNNEKEVEKKIADDLTAWAASFDDKRSKCLKKNYVRGAITFDELIEALIKHKAEITISGYKREYGNLH